MKEENTKKEMKNINIKIHFDHIKYNRTTNLNCSRNSLINSNKQKLLKQIFSILSSLT